MAQLDNEFDPTAQEPSQAFEIIPVGKYRAYISASEVLDTKDGTGSYAKFEYTLIDPPYENRKVWQNVTLKNKSEKAVAFGRRELTSICLAVGIDKKIKDTSEVHDIPLVIKLKIKPAKGDYDTQNEVAGHESLTAAVAATPAAVVSPGLAKPAAVAAVAAATPPWKRK